MYITDNDTFTCCACNKELSIEKLDGVEEDMCEECASNQVSHPVEIL